MEFQAPALLGGISLQENEDISTVDLNVDRSKGAGEVTGSGTKRHQVVLLMAARVV